ncbi:protein of unknown function DUF1460 [Rippkaea orientalis PCC 8801]|uniref:DUF1460 domain-containing protein n=1 Tax=Rippkaea orientalis (strain PCC 8801 / RF-1) TaxID=41431 RepID=B7K662_RIPO1|nr:N-acetylmuramoyl-L-alanine amidase-like domain-containing protein [Rippkaea orientalis]ACK68115.1 protein of unknown function DUF1460 [Rippkaea orientalis PCC 8801]
MKKILLPVLVPLFILISPQDVLPLQSQDQSLEYVQKRSQNSLAQVKQNSLEESKTKKEFKQIISHLKEQNFSDLSLGQTVQKVAEQFLGAAYIAGLLDKSEQEKLFISLKEFDCVLFVETVLGLSQNISRQETQYENFVKNIQDLRYANGIIDGYCSRLHYFSDWINDNQKRGNVKNITAELGGIKFDKTLTFMSKNRKLYPKLINNQANYQCILEREKQLNQLDLYYIPHNQIKAIYQKLQPGDIIAIATNIDGLDVTHTGLIYRTSEGNIAFIHASPAGQVTIAQDLQTYAQNVKNAVGIIVARPLTK